MKTFYWIWLHILLIVLVSLAIKTITFTLAFSENILINSNLTSQTAVLIWLSFFVPLIFTAYIHPYRWFWILWVGVFLFFPSIISVSRYVFPMGQIEFWFIKNLYHFGIYPLPNLQPWVFFSLQILILLMIFLVPIALVGLKVRQLFLADNENNFHGPSSRVYIGRYTRIGLLFLFAGIGLEAVNLYLDFLEIKMLPVLTPLNPALSELSPIAGTLLAPKLIVPEWYLLPSFSILRSIPDKTFGLLTCLGMFFIPLLLPWLDKASLNPLWRRPLYAPFLLLFLISILALFYLGTQPFENQIIIFTRVAVAYYFTHLLLILPLISRWESKV